MSEQDPLERELRALMDELSQAPAPDELIDRVAAIPQQEPAPRRSAGAVRGLPSRLVRLPGAPFQLLTGAAAVAVLVLAAALVVATLPGGGPFSGGRPSAPASPPAPAVTATASSAATPATPSTSPVAPSPQVAGPTGGPVPAGFKAASVTFVSADLGWVLGTSPCNTTACIAIARTTDGGRTWAAIPAPATSLAAPGMTQSGSTGVSGLRFATATDGWAFGPELWATHDGGATWHQVAIPGLRSGYSVVALETAQGTVDAVVYDGSQSFEIASSPISSDSWTVAPVRIPVGAGPVPQIQLVRSGAAGWIVQVDRTVVNGARLENAGWAKWTPPCEQALGPAILAASSPTNVVAACDGGLWGPPKDASQNGEHLYVSTDNGTSFTQSPGSVPLQGPSAMAAPAPSTVVLGGWLGQTQGPAIVSTFDGGRTWTTYHLQGTATQQNLQVTFLGFTTPEQGVAIAQSGSQGGELLMSHDGGRTWSTVSVGG